MRRRIRRVRKGAPGNGPVATPAPRPGPTLLGAPRPSTRPTQLCDQSPDARFWTRASRHRPTGARGAEAVETFTATTGQLLDTLGLSPEIDGAGALLTRSG